MTNPAHFTIPSPRHTDQCCSIPLGHDLSKALHISAIATGKIPKGAVSSSQISPKIPEQPINATQIAPALDRKAKQPDPCPSSASKRIKYVPIPSSELGFHYTSAIDPLSNHQTTYQRFLSRR